MNSIIHNDSFVVDRTQSHFVYFFCVDIMQMRSDDVHLSELFFTAKQRFLVVAVCYRLFDHALFYSFAFLVLVSVKHLVRIQLCSQSNKFFNLFACCFVFEHSNHFLVYTSSYSGRIIFWIFAGIETTIDIIGYICVDVIGLYVVHHTVCVGKQQRRSISVLGFNVVVMKVVHQSLAQVQYIHAQIYRFVVEQCGFLYVNCSQVLVKYRTSVVVYLCCQF